MVLLYVIKRCFQYIYLIFITIIFFITLKLLEFSRYLEYTFNVDSHVKILKENSENQDLQNSSTNDITEAQIQLTRPLETIIQETFQEELLKLHNKDETSSLDVRKRKVFKANCSKSLVSQDAQQSQIITKTRNNDISNKITKSEINKTKFSEKSESQNFLNDSNNQNEIIFLQNTDLTSQKSALENKNSNIFNTTIAQIDLQSNDNNRLNTSFKLELNTANINTLEASEEYSITVSEKITNIHTTELKEHKSENNQINLQSDNKEVTMPDQTATISNNSSDIINLNKQIRVLTLNANEHQDTTLYRLKHNWVLQFRLGPSLFGRKILLYCNYPKNNGSFERNDYQLLKWSQDDGCKNADDTASYTEITVQIAGSFHYYFSYENEKEYTHQGSGFFLVDPTLTYGKNETLPLDCIQCQTVLAKSLGKFNTWENKLRVTKESGYNMIHFTPIQQLGVSNSCYSLSNQLQLNSIFNYDDTNITYNNIKTFIEKLRVDWKITSICDIVLNHTANESEWLKEHPEATYNCKNCPYMRPAYLLDAALHLFSKDIEKNLYDTKGIPSEISDENHMNAIRHILYTEVIPNIKLQEMFMCDVMLLVSEFLNLARNTVPTSLEQKNDCEELKLIQNPEFKRLESTVDMNLALKLYNTFRSNYFDEESRLKKCGEDFKIKLEELNNIVIEELNGHINSAIENSITSIRYFRIQSDGPKIKEISLKNPLVFRYFTDYGKPKTIKEYEAILYSDKSKFLMAHNGWVMNTDPLRNFADPDSNVYIRRELIAWGDSVKLRYGEKPEDSPFLWEYMKKYVEQTAEIFDGVRLDNCHSTPVVVAEYLLDCARRIRPNLYVVAELFTNSDQKDNIFINRLGITSLIREAMSAWDSHEQGRLVYRYGGDPVGAFCQPNVRPLVPSVAHALFLDLTHDNPSPIEKRSVFDLIPSTALVNMACCASGSSRGYDELVPHHIHVVDETREYAEWTDDENVKETSKVVRNTSGLIAIKKALNNLHFKLSSEGYNQVFVDQMDADIVAVTRHRPQTHESVILVAFTAFSHPNINADKEQRYIKPLKIEGNLDEIVLEATLSHIDLNNAGNKYSEIKNFKKDEFYINGLSEYELKMKEHIQIEKSDVLEEVDSGESDKIQLNFKNFKPGSVVVIKVSISTDVKQSIQNLRRLINNFSTNEIENLCHIIDELTLADLNRVLYRCDQEESDDGKGFSTYNIPNFGNLVYSGLQGIISPLSHIRPNNDLGHPLCQNLRDGNWLIDYIWQRLLIDTKTSDLANWIKDNTNDLKKLPRYLIPSYFDVVVTNIYIVLLEQCYKLMSDFVRNGSTFVKGLSLGSIQFAAFVKSAPFPNLSPNLSKPSPEIIQLDNGEIAPNCVTLSAGLPHFSTGYTRNWGRDTFISLRGLFILTGRFEEARYHILAYGACLRHGLIPNLLDKGKNARFNCRDAVWWWLYSIKCYVEETPYGFDILSDKVSRLFPTDDSQAEPTGAYDQELSTVMQKAIEIHFQGLVFRERNAGKTMDEHMTDRGFDIQIGVHPETGFVFGGNEWNCGTWMDKMGSSEKAGNKGAPCTPRDGSAVEIIGLSKAVISWLDQLNQKNKYPFDGVQRSQKNGTIIKWTFKQWSEKIQANFEKLFWIDEKPKNTENRQDLVNKKNIYKDCYGATQSWTDYQLRCNFPIAMVVAPELFNSKNAWLALEMTQKYLLGPLGMKTLDPEDWAYCGDYDNSNDSSNRKVAHGFNYHQGPEWIWPVGYFLRALLYFANDNDKLNATLSKVKVILSNHFIELQTSVWKGLPELTNSNGSYCKDSSRTQAWSMASILEVLYDLQNIESKMSNVKN